MAHITLHRAFVSALAFPLLFPLKTWCMASYDSKINNFFAKTSCEY